MTIDEMQELRQALEARVRTVADEVVAEFQRRTNLTVDGLSIDMTYDQTIGERRRRAIVTGARLQVEL